MSHNDRRYLRFSAGTPQHIARTYAEAASLLSVSPRTSAAMSRRCLQDALHQQGFRLSDLSLEIDAALRSPKTPPGLADVLTTLKTVSDFSLCPDKAKNPGQVIDVEPGEAETLLALVAEVIFSYFGAPGEGRKRKVAFSEEELSRGEKLDALRVLANGIAHDFNNLLAAVVCNIELAKMSSSHEDIVLEKLEKAGAILMEARDLTRQLILFSRGEEPVRRTLHISGLIEDCCRLLLEGSQVRCEFIFPDNAWSVEVDEDQLRQAFTSLIDNAREAMPRGGTLRISITNVPAAALKCPPLLNKNYLRISVRDEGPGIPKEHTQEIFSPYVTTKTVGSRRGTGLGLAVCYTIIKRHGGHISVESGEGSGTTFHVYLPSALPEESLSAETEDASGRAKGRILLVDAEESSKISARDILCRMGYELEEAADGHEAIGICARTDEGDHPFDVVILDVAVSGGGGAIETLRQLRAMDPALRALISGGHGADRLMADFERSGFDGFIAKPYRTDDFEAILPAVLEQPEPAA